MAPAAIKQPLNNIHHTAYRCRDAQQTRWFWEEVMGFELKMALTFDTDPATGMPYEYMHMFFLQGDGNLIAFFDAPDDCTEDKFTPKEGYDLHLAFECDTEEELEAWRKHFNASGVICGDAIDHDFVKSVYVYDPNGLQVEVTVKTPAYGDIVAEESAQVDDIMREWTQRTRAKKEDRFGAQRLDMRGELSKENLFRIVEMSIDRAPPEVAEQLKAALAAAR